jgi:hypothetical protein
MNSKGVLQTKDKKLRFRKALNMRRAKQGSSCDSPQVQLGHRDGFATLSWGRYAKCPPNDADERPKQSNCDDAGTRNAVLSNDEPLKPGTCDTASNMSAGERVNHDVYESETKPRAVFAKTEVKSSLGSDDTENTIDVLTFDVNKVPTKLEELNKLPQLEELTFDVNKAPTKLPQLPQLVKLELDVGKECKLEWSCEQSLSESSKIALDNELDQTSNHWLSDMLSIHFARNTATDTCATNKISIENDTCFSTAQDTTDIEVDILKMSSVCTCCHPMGHSPTHHHDIMGTSSSTTEKLYDENYGMEPLSIIRHEKQLPRCQRVRDQMNANLQHAQQTWDLALKPIKIQTQFVHALVAMHLGHPELLTKDLFWSHVTMLANIFQSHALQQTEFQSLTPNEQVRLLKKNTPTFVLHLLLGYMRATDGLSQMSWLLPNNKIPDDVKRLRLMTVTPDRLNAVVGLFSQSDMVLLIHLTKDARLWRHDEVYLVSLACLFNNNSCTQDSFENLLTLSEWAHEVFWIGTKPDSIRHIIKVLEKVHKLLEGSMTSDNEIYSPFQRRDIIETYTFEEELVMTVFFRSFDQAYGSLPLSPQLSKSMVDFASGIPLPRDVGPVGFRNAQLRMHSLLFSMCECFSDLPYSSKTRAMTVNTSQAMVANMARIEVYPSIKEQIGHYVKCGAMPDVSLPPCHDRKITILSINKNSALMNTESGSRMKYLLDELRTLVLDEGTFRLLMLVLLTNGLTTTDGRNEIHQI